MKEKKITEIQEEAIFNSIINCIYFLLADYSDQPPKFFFDKIWKFATQNFISESSFLETSIMPLENPFFIRFQLNLYDYFLIYVTYLLQRAGINYAPDVNVKTDTLPAEFNDPSKPMIVVGVHNGFAFGARIANHYNRSISMISSESAIENTLKLSGIENSVNVIKNDKYSLIQYEKLMSQGEILVTAIDYAGPDKRYIYFKKNIIEFATARQIPLYFMRSEVTHNGSVLLEFKKSSIDHSVNLQADDFIHFFNQNETSKRELAIEKA